ncbi:hypothetical protein GCM10010399_30950 [Dactylosporangium fulvum]|uniref:helix-turn-helix domain-containing protein n=1 Tax=Dactylosporangium fulvum TaxID=53359 RepID=UPI00337FABF1
MPTMTGMHDTRSDPPRPEGLMTPAEFVAALAALRGWSGLTYRQLAAKARASGDVMPSSTIAAALSRPSLPRAELVAAFVRACGIDDDTTQRWLAARQRLAAAAAVPGPVPESATGSDIGSVTPVPATESPTEPTEPTVGGTRSPQRRCCWWPSLSSPCSSPAGGTRVNLPMGGTASNPPTSKTATSA